MQCPVQPDSRSVCSSVLWHATGVRSRGHDFRPFTHSHVTCTFHHQHPYRVISYVFTICFRGPGQDIGSSERDTLLRLVWSPENVETKRDVERIDNPISHGVRYIVSHCRITTLCRLQVQ